MFHAASVMWCRQKIFIISNMSLFNAWKWNLLPTNICPASLSKWKWYRPECTMGVDVAQKVDLKPIPFAPMNFLEPAKPTGKSFHVTKGTWTSFEVRSWIFSAFNILEVCVSNIFWHSWHAAPGILSGSPRGILQTWWYLSARTCIVICSPTLVECPRSQRATTFWSPQLFKTISGEFGDSTSYFLRWYVDSGTERLVVRLGFRGAHDSLIQVAEAQLVVFNDQNTNWWLNWQKACPFAKFVGIVPEIKKTQIAKIAYKPKSNQ